MILSDRSSNHEADDTTNQHTPAAESPTAEFGNNPDYSVSVQTNGGWVYVAEFRTYGEATSLAKAATSRSGLKSQIRNCGHIVMEFAPEHTIA